MTTAVDRLGWREALATHGAAWTSLVADAGLNPTLAPDWMDAAIESHGYASDVTVAIARDAAGLCGVMPVRSHVESVRGLPARIVELGASPVVYHRAAIARDATPAAIADLIAASLPDRWDMLRLSDVPADSPTAAAFDLLAQRRGWRVTPLVGESSPYLPIDVSWDDYVRALSRKIRTNLNRSLRKPLEIPGTEMRWYETGADTAQLLDAILSVERTSWKHPLGRSIAARPVETDYHRRLLALLTATDRLMANVLYADGRPIAYALGCLDRGWAGHLKTSFDANERNAGGAVIAHSVRRAFERGAKEYDFLGQAAPHKLNYTSSVRAHRGWIAYNDTARGWLLQKLQALADRVKARRGAATDADDGNGADAGDDTN
jgi:CelD/BcsL family acetyltransferase involved in cellulose biosynthesis